MNITIIGLGVIGGSLGLAIKQTDPNITVTGYDSVGHIDAALHRDAIDFGSISLPSLLHDADIIFVCTPVHTIIKLLPTIAKYCKRSAIITDVGSTKSEIANTAKKVFRKNGIFIGGHPMAGSEGKGIEFADALLFQNATYVLCADTTQKKRITKLTSLLHSIGARVLFLSAKDHDTIAASISHLPQLIAVAMMNMVERKNKKHHGYLQLAAGGFRDITRIASSPYGMWNDILASNNTEIRKAVKEFSVVLSQFEKDLQTSSRRNTFAQRFRNAKKMRDAIPKNSKGFLQPVHDIFVSVDDKPGVLSQMTTALYKANINIKDMELLKIREGRGGTFRLSFDSKIEADKAKKVLVRTKINVL
ncbi:MAG: prephenate dehydrogenase [Bacteroidota bacterium]|nr:prephenate dehydrogenase [Bacteroidota bacterium]